MATNIPQLLSINSNVSIYFCGYCRNTLHFHPHFWSRSSFRNRKKIICVVLLSLKYSCYGNTVFANHQKVALCNIRYDFMNEIVIQYVQFMKSLENATSFLNVLQSCYTSLQSSAAHKSLYWLLETVPPISKLFWSKGNFSIVKSTQTWKNWARRDSLVKDFLR